MFEVIDKNFAYHYSGVQRLVVVRFLFCMEHLNNSKLTCIQSTHVSKVSSCPHNFNWSYWYAELRLEILLEMWSNEIFILEENNKKMNQNWIHINPMEIVDVVSVVSDQPTNSIRNHWKLKQNQRVQVKTIFAPTWSENIRICLVIKCYGKWL